MSDYSQLIPALITVAVVYLLYEKTDNNTRSLTDQHEITAEQLKTDLKTLVDAYYHRYIRPHEYPHYRFIIPASRSVTHDKHSIHVMINDPITGAIFDQNTLLQVGSHELAHMLCQVDEGDDHGPLFKDILQKLEALGVELRLFDPSLEIAPGYNDLCG